MRRLALLLSLAMMLGVAGVNAQSKTVGKKGNKTEQTQVKSDKPVKKSNEKAGKNEKNSKNESAGDKMIPGKKGPEGQPVYEGAKGGQYYINKNGNKTYLKK
jgi:colicin import membrane protein